MMFEIIYSLLGYFATGIAIFLIRCYLTIIGKLEWLDDSVIDKDEITIDFFLSTVLWPIVVTFLISDFTKKHSKNKNILLTLYNKLEERYGTKDDDK